MGITLEYLKDLRFKAYSDQNTGYSILLDAFKDAEENNNDSMRPTDLILAGLAGCSSMDIVSILKKKKQNIISYKANVTGERSETHPKVFTKMFITYEIKGKDIDEQAVRRAIELSKEKYCSVWAMLKNSVDIEWTYKVENI